MKPGNLLFKVPNPAETRDEGVAIAYRVCGAHFFIAQLKMLESVVDVVCSLFCCVVTERKNQYGKKTVYF